MFLGVPLAIIFLGMGMVERPGDAAKAPFCFCLPGFRESLRRRYFIAAAVMGLGVALFPLVLTLFLDGREKLADYLSVVHVCLQMVSGFLLGMAIGLTIGTPRLILSRLAWNLLMLLAIPLVLAAVVAFTAFIEYPILGIPPGLALCVFVWSRLGDMQQLRQGHRAMIEDAWEQQAEVGVTKTASPQVDGAFRGLMARRRRSDAMRYVWGSLYRTFGMTLSRGKWTIVLVFVCVVVLGYVPEWLVRAAFVGAGLAATGLHLPVTFDGLWLPVGRRERCYATMATAVAASLLLIVAATVLTVLSWLFSPFMPDLFGGDLHYVPMDVRMIGLPPLLVPWVFAIRLLAYRFRFAETIAGWVVMAAAILFFLFGGREWLERIDGAAAIRILAGGWASFLLALRYTYTTGPLAEASPAGS